MDSSKRLSLSDIKNISALYDGTGDGDSTMCSYADSLYGNLMEQIADFEETLRDDEEIGAYISSFGREMLIRIENVGYHNPYFIIFYGTLVDEKSKVQLVQHLSQINIMFVAVKARELNGKPKRLGFRVGG
ncbi:MAG: DUF6173 family protein [Thermodesulfobacteriota bacterium]|nr:DUF6173 family protein [Thermodesulfobacteriota bacterium]